jgi:hypothetical protein
VPVATAGVVERWDTGDAAEERARLGGEWVEEQVVDRGEYELGNEVRCNCGGPGRRYTYVANRQADYSGHEQSHCSEE